MEEWEKGSVSEADREYFRKIGATLDALGQPEARVRCRHDWRPAARGLYECRGCGLCWDEIEHGPPPVEGLGSPPANQGD